MSESLLNQPLNPSVDALAAPLAIVAHDAGAVNHILAWASGADQSRLRYCLDGPALALWRQSCGAPSHPSAQMSSQTHPPHALAATLAGCKTLLSGTGWASNLEHDARRIARQLGIKSIAVIDHWTNYRARFSRDGEEILPDEIWVSDDYARQLAADIFKDTAINIVQQPNLYLAALVREVERLQQASAPQADNENDESGDRLLYVLEPIRQSWGDLPQPGEFAALDFMMENLSRVGAGPDTRIRLRPHPSDPIGKYDDWIRRQDNSRITIDRAPSLAASLAWANRVAGCQTYAMVIALAAGRQVICSIPPWAPPCVLPHAGIVRLAGL